MGESYECEGPDEEEDEDKEDEEEEKEEELEAEDEGRVAESARLPLFSAIMFIRRVPSTAARLDLSSVHLWR